ncbi:RNA polymerase sigma-70 factor [Pedobacter sp. MC2016-14]|uniref:RNA polymerase sigma-70 factor n=1 Tax=Pedobacter sp. MC2016-14 TaxID=2897327 RepID=UPI001E4792FF|nr:RNA polymerase sigma-70 factor [Pedobacter sp. MC2016-14]MCD0487798.1 RNA polymerase sigma-70 factor [Pedobacter sp. MC2016-14]
MQNQSEEDDNRLLKAIANDDEKSFARLYAIYWQPLYLTAAKVLRSQEEAEDVVQDVFLSFWNRRKEVKISTSLKAYLMTSVKYKSIHYIEKNITRRDYLELLTDVLTASSPAVAETNIYVKELQALIDKTLKNMPAKMHKVYTLSRDEHLTHKEIADQLGISTETVKKHIQHALQQLREAIVGANVPLTAVLISILFKK